MWLALLAAVTAVAPVDSILLRVLTINDFHGALEPRVLSWSAGRPVGGIAALKGMMDRFQTECGCPVIRLDAGDQLQGTLGSNLVFGRSTVEAMNLLGLHAAAIGNHELDWGVDTLVARIGEARYPWLIGNVFDSATGRRPGWAHPYGMISVGGQRVGVIGYLTPETKTIVLERNVRGLQFRGGRLAIADVLEEVKARRPNLTMIVAHAGAYCDSGCRGEIIDFARQFDSTEIDLIVAGHTHTLINTVVNGIPIVSARANGTAIGIADLTEQPDGHRAWRVRVESVYADRVRPDSAGAALVDRYRPLVDRLATKVVVRLGDSLVTRLGENPLGNLIADAQRHVAPADFGLMNNGGIRRSLLPGPITYSDLFELHPFGNSIVRVTLTGSLLKAVLEHALDKGYPDCHISGLQVRYDITRPAGERVVEIRRLDGRLVAPGRRYVLALSDFLAGGGGGFAMLRPLAQRRSGMTDLEATISWLARLPSPVRAPLGQRWIPVPTQ